MIMSWPYCAKLIGRIYFLRSYMVRLMVLFPLNQHLKRWLWNQCLKLNACWIQVITYLVLDMFLSLSLFFLKATKWKKGVISVPLSESYFFKIWTRPNSAQSLLLVVFSILNGVLRIKLRLIICKESTCLLYYLSRFFKNYFKIENNLGPDSAGVKMLTWYLSTPIQIPHMI